MDEGILNLTPTQTPPMPPAVTVQWGTRQKTRVCEKKMNTRKPLQCNYLYGAPKRTRIPNLLMRGQDARRRREGIPGIPYRVASSAEHAELLAATA